MISSRAGIVKHNRIEHAIGIATRPIKYWDFPHKGLILQHVYRNIKIIATCPRGFPSATRPITYCRFCLQNCTWCHTSLKYLYGCPTRGAFCDMSTDILERSPPQWGHFATHSLNYWHFYSAGGPFCDTCSEILTRVLPNRLILLHVTRNIGILTISASPMS